MKYKATIDNYHIDNGDVTADVGMLFLGWKEGMKQLAVSKKEAKFAHKKQGWVSMSLNKSIIQTNGGQSHRWREFWQDVLARKKSCGRWKFCGTRDYFKF
jgi:hypothetical protein